MSLFRSNKQIAADKKKAKKKAEEKAEEKLKESDVKKEDIEKEKDDNKLPDSIQKQLDKELAAAAIDDTNDNSKPAEITVEAFRKKQTIKDGKWSMEMSDEDWAQIPGGKPGADSEIDPEIDSKIDTEKDNSETENNSEEETELETGVTIVEPFVDFKKPSQTHETVQRAAPRKVGPISARPIVGADDSPILEDYPDMSRATEAKPNLIHKFTCSGCQERVKVYNRINPIRCDKCEAKHIREEMDKESNN